MKRRVAAVVLAVVAAGGALSITAAPAASAHPLGNFTHNTYVGFTIEPDRIDVDHVLDLAEVPTYQEQSAMDTDGDGAVSDGEAAAWGRDRCATAATQITATTSSGPVSWTVGRSAVTFPPGQAGLSTTRLECRLSAAISDATSFDADVLVEDGRVGWHEVTAVGDGVEITSDVPAQSTSARLTAYPVDVAPLAVTSVHVDWSGAPATTTLVEPVADEQPVASSVATTIAPLGLDSLTQSFTDLIGRQEITFGFALLALAISIVLGGVHALAPGHGKTLMAASLVGTGGKRRDAVVLGASVTTAHTAGVVVLAVVLSVTSAFAAESAYPWLGLFSALVAVGVGVSLFRQARNGGGLGHSHAHPHPHPHGHGHDDPDAHDDHGHDHHGHDDHAHGDHAHDDHGHGSHGHGHHHDHPQHAHGTVAVATPVTQAPVATVPQNTRPATRRVVALGLAGGLVPSPSAVVVLLAGFALGRSWFALLLVVAYGIGMAVTLCATGFALVRVGGLSRRVAEGNAVPRPVAALLHRLPVIAATTVVVAGVWLGVRSILSM